MANLMQKVTLVLTAIFSFVQAHHVAIIGASPSVMTRSDQVGAQTRRVIEESLKFDFPITENIGIGRPASPVL